MRHKIRHRKQKCFTLSAILSLSKPKTVPTAPREAHQLGSKGFFIRQRGQWTTDMGDSGAPPPPQGKGGGQAGGARDAANSLLQFLRPSAEITPPSPAASPKTAETATEGWVLAQQQQYVNTERPAYGGANLLKIQISQLHSGVPSRGLAPLRSVPQRRAPTARFLSGLALLSSIAGFSPTQEFHRGV